MAISIRSSVFNCGPYRLLVFFSAQLLYYRDTEKVHKTYMVALLFFSSKDPCLAFRIHFGYFLTVSNVDFLNQIKGKKIMNKGEGGSIAMLPFNFVHNFFFVLNGN